MITPIGGVTVGSSWGAIEGGETYARVIAIDRMSFIVTYVTVDAYGVADENRRWSCGITEFVSRWEPA